MLDDIYSQLKSSAENAIEYTREQLRTIRTGKPTPSILEGVIVKAYGADMRLRDVATVGSDSSNSLIIQPFDVSTIKDIETAILSSNLNLTPRIESSSIRVIFPPLNDDQRQQFVKFASAMAEEGKIRLRNNRDVARKDVKQLFDDKGITEDDRFRAFEEIDKMTKQFSDEIDSDKKKKEEEVLTI
ncbi:MAG: ribosome recycling factor [Candidatus Roizmanbacteria bacterium]